MGNLSQVTVRQPQTSEQSFVDSDGILHIPALALSPSELWSPAFKQWYATTFGTGPELYRPPTRNASKGEWDSFDKLMEDSVEVRCLALARKCYSVKVVEAEMAGVRVGIISPKDGVPPKKKHRILINLHCGGFVYGRGLSVGELESIPVASIGEVTVITVDYRQAPFHQYPAASEDVEAVYKELLKQYEARAIGIFGCSAGGALTAQAVARFQARRLPLPGAVGIFSSAPSPIWANKGDSGIWWSGNGLPKRQLSGADKALLEPVEWYMEHADRNDPLAYPESSDDVMEKFPPTLLLSGMRAFEMSMVVTAHAKFLKLGVDSSLYIMEGGTHGAHVWAVGTPEAHDTNAYIAHWFDRRLAG